VRGVREGVFTVGGFPIHPGGVRALVPSPSIFSCNEAVVEWSSKASSTKSESLGGGWCPCGGSWLWRREVKQRWGAAKQLGGAAEAAKSVGRSSKGSGLSSGRGGGSVTKR
jgi:hypothetical protein